MSKIMIRERQVSDFRKGNRVIGEQDSLLLLLIIFEGHDEV